MLIKALEVTLAPFVQPEKPQVFPTPAANFIKDGPDIIMLEAISRRRRGEWRRFRETVDGTVMPVLIEIFCGDLTQSGRASRSFERASAALSGCWNDAAHIHVSAGAPVPIWFAPSQICNIICTGERTCETSRSLTGEGGESVDGAAAEALSNRWRFFTTYLAPRFSPVLRHPFLATRDSEC